MPMSAPETPAAVPSGQPYDPSAVEATWSRYWEAAGVFHADPERVISGEREPFVIAMPPPNVTGRLHMGHALQDTVQDLLIRYHRARGFEALWIPGMDHAGIATQNVVERDLRARGIERKEIGREAFLEHVWTWKAEYGGAILEQKRRLGDSCDWRFERFTMDDGLSRAVQHTFVRLYEEGLVYRGDYLVNWDPDNQTVLSNEEVDTVERPGSLWTVRYAVVDADGQDTGEFLSVATTRPETIPADTGVAVHPDDDRFRHLVGQRVRVPLTDRLVPVVADDAIKMDFGAGALKVTPGHSEIDFEIGRRHGLPTLSILNPDGTLNELAGAYAGLDRAVAKKQVVADLDAAVLLAKTEAYTVQTPVSSRSGAVIEPLLSPQWYVSMKPLAEKALAAIHTGEVAFHPARWKNEMVRWLDEGRDWPISRQLWWGHRIPIWYPTRDDGSRDEAAFAVSIDSPGAGYVQDDDVLDTWFSSWLWPFATLGWPEAGGDGKPMPAMQAFYPGSVLVSGYDILGIWISRMLMAGLHFTGEVPFRDVAVTGMVKDKLGRKMSKSLGNGIDPLDMADQYGADAVRFTLATLCAQGQDIKLDPSGFEGGRNFANKLWNAFNVFGRFLETDADAHPTTDVGPMPDPATLVEQWIATRFAETVAAVDEALGKYRISEAAQTVYDFVWRDVCDWYLEVAKPLPGEPMDARTLAFSVGLYENVLRLVHPFMPFVSEELWWKLRPRPAGQALAAAAWPTPGATFPEEAATFASVQEVVGAVRQIRAQYSVAPSKRIEAEVHVPVEAAAEALDRLAGATVTRLAGLSTLRVGTSMEKPPASAAVLVGRMAVFVPLAGTIDLDAERARLNKEIDAKAGFLRSVEGKLANETFVSRAPEAVVAVERQKAADAAAQIEALRATLADLG
jgi:valyl-tRNA synthetase